MAPNPVVIPRTVIKDPTNQVKVDPLYRICRIPTSLAFATIVALLVAKFDWPRSWLWSGAAIQTYLILVGASYGYRILYFLHLWTLLASINLIYAVASTSWLLNGLFTATCWPAILLTSLFQFENAAYFTRGKLRAFISQLQFVNDKIAFFNIPALEIDVDIAGLLVVRGITLSLSSLTVEAHGIEVGIKLTDDIELALQVELVKVYLFRRIEVSDIYANLKGGAYEMTFGELEESTEDAEGNPLMSENTPLLRAASVKSDGTFPEPEKIKMTERMTDGKTMENSSPETGLKSIEKLSPGDDEAMKKFNETLNQIKSTSSINVLKKQLQETGGDEYTLNYKTLRAAICSHLHETPSVPHPPQKSIKVSTIKKSTSPKVKRFQHRFPLLLRMLLNPVSYFHPIAFSSITATASGLWIRTMLLDKVFQGYSENDSDLRNLEGRLSAWLNGANFAVELDDITGLAQIPIVTDYDINCFLGIKDVLIYRTLPKHVQLREAVRLGGADATFTIPTYLLPHHEHIIPPKPTFKDKDEIKGNIDSADGKPKQFQAEKELEQAEKDEANVQMSIHVKLPACLDQELLNFIAALVKATKIVEMEKDSDAVETQNKGFKDFARNLNHATKDSFKKAVVGGVVNDKWIAKLVGKVTKMLETAQGDVGYSGNIPVALKPYRDQGIGEATKILP